MAMVSAAAEKRSRSLSSGFEKRKWADWEDEEELSPDSDVSTSAREWTDASSGDESGGDTSPKRPPGQFGAAAPLASAPAVGVPVNTQQVFLMPVLMNGVQVLMPMVAAPFCAAGQAPGQAPGHSPESLELQARSLSAKASALDLAARKMKLAASTEEEDGRTTLMFRNLPKSYTRSDLVRILDAEGFYGAYCFVYVPTDFKSLSGFGYAFVAFHQHGEAARAKVHFQGYAWGEAGVQPCDVAWSGPVQGREQHVERYRNSPVMHATVPDEYKPAVFENGQRMSFPAPTKAIRAPRLRHGIAGDVLGPGAADN